MALSPPLEQICIAIHLVLARQLMVTHFDMDLNPTIPVKFLKEELSSQLGLPASQQQWFYRNQLLLDDNTLERAGVIYDSIIEVRPTPSHSSSQALESLAALSAEAHGTNRSREV